MYAIPIYIFNILFGILGMLSIQQIQFSEKNYLYITSINVKYSIECIIESRFDTKIWIHWSSHSSINIKSFWKVWCIFYFGFKLCPLPLNRIKFFGLFLILAIFTTPSYFLMGLEFSILLKLH